MLFLPVGQAVVFTGKRIILVRGVKKFHRAQLPVPARQGQAVRHYGVGFAFPGCGYRFQVFDIVGGYRVLLPALYAAFQVIIAGNGRGTGIYAEYPFQQELPVSNGKRRFQVGGHLPGGFNSRYFHHGVCSVAVKAWDAESRQHAVHLPGVPALPVCYRQRKQLPVM